MLLREFSTEGSACASAEQLAQRRGRKQEVRTAVYLLVVLTVGAYLPSPLFPEYQHAFGFSDLTMTLVYATFALVSAPALLLFGPASDALGRRVVLLASVLAAAFASGCFALAAGPTLLFVGRAAQGLALGAATGAATALIAERAPAGKRAQASVVASTAFVGGTAAGPLVAGVLAQYAPMPLVVPYLLHLALLGISWHRVSALPTSGARARRWRPTRPHIPAGLRLRLGTAAAGGFLAWTVAGLFLAVVPTVLTRAAQINNLAVTGGVLAAFLVCSVLVQPLVLRCGAGRAQLYGLVAVLGSLVALTWTGGSSLPVIMAAAVVAGIGHGLAYGGAVATIDATAPDRQRGSINGALYLTFYLGTGIPAVAVGFLTLGHPLTTAISWISATAAALVPLVGAALVLTDRTPRISVATLVGEWDAHGVTPWMSAGAVSLPLTLSKFARDLTAGLDAAATMWHGAIVPDRPPGSPCPRMSVDVGTFTGLSLDEHRLEPVLGTVRRRMQAPHGTRGERRVDAPRSGLYGCRGAVGPD